ncbi:MAG: lipase family protein [Myxococcota bacterium]
MRVIPVVSFCRIILPALSSLLILAGCPEPEPEPEDETPYLEPGGCGLEGYEWLPADELGAVVSTREDALSPIAPEAIDSLLSGYTEELSPVPYGARVLRMRYTTQHQGREVEATGFVSVPWLPEGMDQEFPVVLWLHGTTGFMGQCSPSYMGGENAMGNYLLSSLGYAVVAPDYIGLDAGADFDVAPDPRHSYLGIEQTGIGAWDMVRAARDFFAGEEIVDARLSDEVVLWGGSQGGHAAFAADLLAPYYAPELDVKASVALIPPTDLLGQAQWAFSDVVPTTAALAAFLVAQHYWYGEQASLEEVFVPEMAAALPDAMYMGCDAEDVIGEVTEVGQVFQPDFIEAVLAGDWEALEPWSCFMRESSIVHTSIPRLAETPTLMVLGEEDQLVYTPVEREAFDSLCEMGYRLEYLECAGAGHTQGAAWSLPEQLEWVAERLEGVPIDPERLCTRQAPVRCEGQPEQ